MRNASFFGVFPVIGVCVVFCGAHADSIRIHDQAGATGPMVTLSDIGELDGTYARSLGNTVVGAFREGAGQLKLSLGAIQDALGREKVNWGQLSLQGHETCNVFRTGFASDPPASDSSPAVANLETDIGLSSAMSLRDRIIEQIEQTSGKHRADLRVTFISSDRRLHASVLDRRVEIEPQTGAKYGRLSFAVRQEGAGSSPHRFTIRAQVARRVMALVATRAIQRGEMFAVDAVKVKELWLDEDRDEPLSKPALVTGQIAAKHIRPGRVIYPEHVRCPSLVRRGELITVDCFSGGLVIRTAARAKEDGGFGDVITAQNEKTRETFAVTITGHRIGSIHLAENLVSGDDT